MEAVTRLCRRLAWAAAITTAAAAIAGCSTTGRSFDASAIGLLQAGVTTLDEAKVLMGADPTDVYRQADGSATARWAHKASFVPDALYFRQELWLAFGPDGRFQRIVESVNVPRAYLAEAKQASQHGHPFLSNAASHAETSVPLAADPSGTPIPNGSRATTGSYEPAATYPLSQ